MKKMKMTAAKYEAGKATAFGDARRGRFNQPTKRDHKDWSRGYIEAHQEMRYVYGENYLAKMGAP